MPVRWRTWQLAMTEALYAPGGFYRGTSVPAAHFRTSAHIGAAFADALLALAGRVDALLDRPTTFDVCDLGGGGGELLTAMLERAPTVAPRLAGRLRLLGVDVADRPPTLDPSIEWLPELPAVTGLLIANEWLDNVPLDVAVIEPDGPRLLQVNDDGDERPGALAVGRDVGWLDRWAPRNAERVEIGVTRDAAWARAVRSVERGAAVAIDYAGDTSATLTGFRDGREVAPRPDGSCDLTAHVFFPSVAAAGDGPVVLSQREALLALGLHIRRPPEELAAADPKAYVAALAGLSRQAVLVDPDGLGAFRWLIQSVGISHPLGAEDLL